MQGVEAQTLANVWLALENDLEVIPILNKVDLPSERGAMHAGMQACTRGPALHCTACMDEWKRRRSTTPEYALHAPLASPACSRPCPRTAHRASLGSGCTCGCTCTCTLYARAGCVCSTTATAGAFFVGTRVPRWAVKGVCPPAPPRAAPCAHSLARSHARMHACMRLCRAMRHAPSAWPPGRRRRARPRGA